MKTGYFNKAKIGTNYIQIVLDITDSSSIMKAKKQRIKEV